MRDALVVGAIIGLGFALAALIVVFVAAFLDSIDGVEVVRDGGDDE